MKLSDISGLDDFIHHKVFLVVFGAVDWKLIALSINGHSPEDALLFISSF